MRGVRWDKVYRTNLDQVGSKKANLDQLGQVGRRFAVFCLLRKAPLTNLDQVGPVLFPTVFRALPRCLLEFLAFSYHFRSGAKNLSGQLVLQICQPNQSCLLKSPLRCPLADLLVYHRSEMIEHTTLS